MPKYRKKPVVIEAIQNLKTSDIPDWLQGKAVGQIGYDIHIHTLEGVMTANPGDWIIRGVKGELYPCKPDIFESTYEFVPEQFVPEGSISAGTVLLGNQPVNVMYSERTP